MKRSALSGMVCFLLAGAAAAASPVVRDANGRVLGYYSGQAYIGPGFDTGYLIVSSTGYVFAIDDWDSTFVLNYASNVNKPLLPEVHFASTDCSGQGFGVYQVGAAIAGGFVVKMDGGQLFYAPKSVSSEQVFTRSKRSGGVCQPFAMQSYGGVQLFLNDPIVTGVPNDIPTGQPEIVISTVGSGLFLDGFEQTA